MDKIVFGHSAKNKNLSAINLLSRNNKSKHASAPVSAHMLMNLSAPVSVSVPAPVPVSAHTLMNLSAHVHKPAPAPVSTPEPVSMPVPKHDTSVITELLAKNAKLQNDVNSITNKYNTLVHQLRVAGMIQ